MGNDLASWRVSIGRWGKPGLSKLKRRRIRRHENDENADFPAGLGFGLGVHFDNAPGSDTSSEAPWMRLLAFLLQILGKILVLFVTVM